MELLKILLQWPKLGPRAISIAPGSRSPPLVWRWQISSTTGPHSPRSQPRPVVVFFANAYGLQLILGLDPKDIVLLATALLVSVVTLGTGRTSMMQGAVHLVLFATYLFLACVP